MVVTENEISQRERNRLDTWNAVHRAASEIALEGGLGAATIDAVAARAGISRRTFFNYFATKEDAVLGTCAPRVPEAAVERFRTAQEDELTRVVHLFVSVVQTALVEETHARRRQLVEAMPELRERVIDLLGEVERLVTDVVQSRVQSRDDGAAPDVALGVSGDPAALRALLMLAGTITKHAFSQYQQADVDDLAPFLDESVAMFRKVVDATR